MAHDPRDTGPAPLDAPAIGPEDAARVLREIRAGQARVVRHVGPWFPAWYVTGVGLFVTGVQYLTEPGTAMAPAVIGIIMLTLLLAGLVLLLVLVLRRRHRPHRSLVSPGLVAAFVGWVLLAAGGCLVLALRLADAGVPYARAWAGLAMTVFLAATGPWVGRSITRRMAARIEAGR
ncbi:hypothetical protein Sru01_52460 [Sphaerisporangium rufum]|uniref:Uncharacterized protein n=1 Tax=Sphaerisporangium rufum TaxID=1381558 RepID=A0A919V204_9ACTN|nr:hypothetical protein [Sphaerisporangium rufum]GII80264.1 hypothetical protein Sru01_52460 [Sphaerisporangium rufum]